MKLLIQTLSKNQVEILEHTAHRAAGGFYCGDSQDMQSLVNSGLMTFAGRKNFVPDPYFRLTEAGREALRCIEAERPKPKLKPETRAQRRYREWQGGPSSWGMSFGDWLKRKRAFGWEGGET